MSNCQTLKGSKSAYSIQTQSTLSGLSENGFKINVLSPKEGIKVSKEITTLIKELELQEQECSPRKIFSKKHMEIPVLCKKQTGVSALEGSTNSQPHQAHQLRTSNKSIMKSQDVFDDSMYFNEMMIQSNCKEEAFARSGSHIIISLSDQTKRIESIETNINEGPQQDAQSIKNSFQGKAIKQTELFSIQRSSKDNKLLLSTYQRPFEKMDSHQAVTKVQKPLRSQVNKKDYLSSCPGKIKLKDYLYMINAAKKQAKSVNNTKKISTEQVVSAQDSITETNHLQRINKINIGKPLIEISQNIDRNDLRIKQPAIKAKYNISNRTMLGTLKADIFSEIQHIQNNLKKVIEELADHKFSNGEPSNESILALYNLRNRFKEEISKNLQKALNILSFQANLDYGQDRNQNE